MLTRALRRFIVLTSFSGLWARGLPLSFLSSAGGKKALGKNNAVFITIAMVVASYFLDAVLSCELAHPVCIAGKNVAKTRNLQLGHLVQDTHTCSVTYFSPVNGQTCSRPSRLSCDREPTHWERWPLLVSPAY